MMKRYLRIFQAAASNFGNDQCTSYAAAIAYYALFSLFPLIVFLISFLGFFLRTEQQREGVVNSIFQLLGQSVDKNTLYTQVNSFAGGRTTLGIVGLVIAAWSASSVFGAIRTGLNVVWNVTRRRPILRTKLLDLGMVVGVGVLIALSFAATAVLAAVQGFSNAILGSSLGVVSHLAFAIINIVVPPGISLLAFAIVYYFAPHAEIRLKNVWLGALTAAVLFEIAEIGFAIYAANFAHYDKVYGSLGAVIAFLFFAYLGAAILLFGGEVTKAYVDDLSGLLAAEDLKQAQPQGTFEQRALRLAKGLIVDDSAHHGTSVPYQPGRQQPMRPGAEMVTDNEVDSQGGEAIRPEESTGSSPPKGGEQNPLNALALAESELQRCGSR